MASDIEKARRKLPEAKSPSNNRKEILPGEGRSPATVNRYLAAMKAAFSLGVKNGKVEINPVKEVALQKEENKRDRYLSADEETRLFKAIPKEYHPLVIVALNTGLRKTEQLSLTWNDIDFQQELIRVKKSKSGKPRYVPMRPVIIETLKTLPRMINNGYVFYGHMKGERLKDIPKEWESWLKQAKIENFHWHDLRHTFASRLVSAGCSLYAVQEFLGHSSIKVTERYSHFEKGYLKEAINLSAHSQVTPELTPGKNHVA